MENIVNYVTDETAIKSMSDSDLQRMLRALQRENDRRKEEAINIIMAKITAVISLAKQNGIKFVSAGNHELTDIDYKITDDNNISIEFIENWNHSCDDFLE